jgi:hypothetical protein
VLSRFDYIVAITCAERPRFPPVHFFLPQAAMTAKGECPKLIFDSPLCGSGNFNHIMRGDSEQEQIKSLLREMWDLTANGKRSRQPEMVSTDTQLMRKPYHCHRNIIKRLPVILNSDPNHHVLEVCQLTARIYRRAFFVPAVAFTSARNASDFNRLFEVLSKCATDDFWVRYPGVLLWVLLVSSATSALRNERSYFMMYLAKIGIFSEPVHWQQIQNAILRFLEVQSMGGKMANA